MAITERTQFLKEGIWSKAPTGAEYQPGVGACIERARLWTQSYKETEGEPEVIRRAKALEKLLENMTIIIKEKELLIGYFASKPNVIPFHPEISYTALETIYKESYLPEEFKPELKEIMAFWKGKDLQARTERLLTPEERRITSADTSFRSTTYIDGISSPVPDYEFLLKHGLSKIIKMVETKLAGLEEDLHSGPSHPDKVKNISKIEEYKAMIISCRAMVRFANRYSILARYLAEIEHDSTRKAELKKISDICTKVPANPPDTFQEALQAQFLSHLVDHYLERLASGASFRADYLFWSYYKKDVIEDKTLTRKEAQELIECQRIKYAELGRMGGKIWRELTQGVGELHVMTLGGVNPDGTDACTELTEVILEATESIRTTQPSYGLRYHPKMSQAVLYKALRCIRAGLAMPSFKNDDVAIGTLLDFGASLEEARNWCLTLCMSPGCCGRKGTRVRNPWSTVPAKLLELALNDGYDSVWTKSQLGLHTGDASKFRSYEELIEAFNKQVRFAVETASRVREYTRYVEADYLKQPYLSSFFEGCIETGRDAIEYEEIPNPWANAISPVDAADSLVALKKLVFEEKRYTMEEVIKALRANWEGYEKMRQEFIEDAPKFGNDDDYADNIAKRDVYDLIVKEYKRARNWSGGITKPLPQSVAAFWSHGRKTGALPNGRKAGEPLSDGGISPGYGMDKKGPTAVLNSVAKIDHGVLKGALLNQRFQPGPLKGEKGFRLFQSYMKTWDDLGIDHVQINVMDTATLRAAQKNPDKYPDLIVRVAGYSAYFNELNRPTQDSIIARTEHALGD